VDFLQVLQGVLDPTIIGLIFIGTVLGMVFGAIPGLNTPIAIALVLPFTYALKPLPSIALIMGVYMAGISGGLISAILLRIPGTVSSIATTIDGYPMAQNGRAAEALAIGTFSSFVGGILSAFALLLLTPLLSRLALGFGPLEYLGTTFLALSLICTLMNGRIIKGFICVCIGLMLASMGISPLDGTAMRLTFGSMDLANGFNMIALIIGAYAFPELFTVAGNLKAKVIPTEFRKQWFYLPKWSDLNGTFRTFVRSTFIGIGIGILPGMGPSVAGMVSYAQAKKKSKHPEEFGHGSAEGLVASECSNNAVTGGAIIPMLALSVPGDSSTAVILGALMIQGIQCGPLLVLRNPSLFQSVILCVFLANIMMFLVQTCTIRFSAKILQIDRAYLLPMIVLFCCTGAFSISNRIFEVWSILLFAIIGYILEKNDYPLMPMILAFVLGPMMEEYFRRTLIYYGSFGKALGTFSVGTILVILGILLTIWGLLCESKKFKAFVDVHLTRFGKTQA
jgi:putative tricarboxylic transport membrane protein